LPKSRQDLAKSIHFGKNLPRKSNIMLNEIVVFKILFKNGIRFNI